MFLFVFVETPSYTDAVAAALQDAASDQPSESTDVTSVAETKSSSVKSSPPAAPVAAPPVTAESLLAELRMAENKSSSEDFSEYESNGPVAIPDVSITGVLRSQNRVSSQLGQLIITIIDKCCTVILTIIRPVKNCYTSNCIYV